MKKFLGTIPGIVICVLLAIASIFVSGLLPKHIISGSVLSLLFGMLLHTFFSRYVCFRSGFSFVSTRILKFAIILMGFSLSFGQIIQVGGFSLIVMSATLACAFLGGYLLGRLLKMNWKLSSLISAGTGICGGSAIAAIAPVIKAKDSYIAYAIAATFIFDVIMIILFPILGRFFNMTDIGYGLWAGTAVNDTSSVVAAGYAFSDTAGNYSIIVKLTRTLSIVPVVLIFSLINSKIEAKTLENSSEEENTNVQKKKLSIAKIFPFFILLFLIAVAIKSLNIIPEIIGNQIPPISKFLMVAALGAIGLKTNIKEFKSCGFAPMIHGFVISLLVVIVAFFVQLILGQM